MMMVQPRFRTCAISNRFVLFLAVVLPCKANFCSDQSSLEVCIQNIEPLLDNDQLPGLPTTKQELEVMCEAFQSGMSCLDDYAKHCMKPRAQNYLQMTVEGARQMMKHLCDDTHYQNEYLKHANCYSELSDEWDLCTIQMKRVVDEYRNKKNQVLTEEEIIKNSCCAKYEFLVCTEDVSFKKCSKEAAAFLRNIAETLSGPMLHGKCKELKPNPCKFVYALPSLSMAPIFNSQAFILSLVPFFTISLV